MSVQYFAQFHIPSYASWLYSQDLTESYAYHKKQLQVLAQKVGTLGIKDTIPSTGSARYFGQLPYRDYRFNASFAYEVDWLWL